MVRSYAPPSKSLGHSAIPIKISNQFLQFLFDRMRREPRDLSKASSQCLDSSKGNCKLTPLLHVLEVSRPLP